MVTDPCEGCDGTGVTRRDHAINVKVPAGVDTGSRLRLRGEGEGGLHGGPPGDLYVVIYVQEHKYFQRDGNNLHYNMPLPFTTLALGGLLGIALVNWWFFLAGRSTVEATRTSPGVQEVTVVVRGGFQPNRIRAAAGAPLRLDRKSTRLNSSHMSQSRMPSSA